MRRTLNEQTRAHNDDRDKTAKQEKGVRKYNHHMCLYTLRCMSGYKKQKNHAIV